MMDKLLNTIMNKIRPTGSDPDKGHIYPQTGGIPNLRFPIHEISEI
jgi:hypothetical protein